MSKKNKQAPVEQTVATVAADMGATAAVVKDGELEPIAAEEKEAQPQTGEALANPAANVNVSDPKHVRVELEGRDESPEATVTLGTGPSGTPYVKPDVDEEGAKKFVTLEDAVRQRWPKLDAETHASVVDFYELHRDSIESSPVEAWKVVPYPPMLVK